jgi:hypothetical protein
MREEMPSVAEEAFQYSGQNFFNQRAVAADKTAIKALNASFHGYTYAFGLNLIDMKIEKATSADDIMLRVWEMPVRGAQYVMGIDPSYCSSEESDAAVIQVYRCFADKLVQVAEFASNEVQPNHLAWVMCHLCGEYGGKNGTILLNLEINGPGNDVYRNMRDLKLQLALQTIKAPDDNDDWLLNALTKTRWYIYTRDDNISASGGGSYNSKTTRTLKVVWYNCYRDMYSTEQLIIRSLPLLDEMRTLRQDGDEIRASGRNHDDLCMGTALAVDAYWQHIRRGMIANNRTYASEMASQVDNKIVPPEPTIYNTLVPNFMNQRRREIHQAAFENLKNSIVGDW